MSDDGLRTPMDRSGRLKTCSLLLAITPLRTMFPAFLPAAVNGLSEPASIALAQTIQCRPIATPFSPHPIATTYVHQGSGGTPRVLLNGFDSSLLEFRRLLPLLAPTGSTWAVDLLGFGFTERPQNVAFHPQDIKTHLYQFWAIAVRSTRGLDRGLHGRCRGDRLCPHLSRLRRTTRLD